MKHCWAERGDTNRVLCLSIHLSCLGYNNALWEIFFSCNILFLELFLITFILNTLHWQDSLVKDKFCVTLQCLPGFTYVWGLLVWVPIIGVCSTFNECMMHWNLWAYMSFKYRVVRNLTEAEFWQKNIHWVTDWLFL